MSYNVTILGKKYNLPARTMSVDDSIEALKNIDKQYQDGEINRRSAVEQLHAFVENLAPGALPPVEDVDTNDLMKACLDIIEAYDAPARKARYEARLKVAGEILNKPEVQKLVKVAESVK